MSDSYHDEAEDRQLGNPPSFLYEPTEGERLTALINRWITKANDHTLLATDAEKATLMSCARELREVIRAR